MKDLENRVKDYWTVRAKDFGTVRKNELKDAISQRWLTEIQSRLPEGVPLRILDVGTGTGYFAILLAGLGHRVTGIDLTPAMLEEAREECTMMGAEAEFLEMDAQKLSFPDNTFDVVLSRNLTWTLPDPEQAYREWFRVLEPGGVLLNFDADYASNVRNQNQKASYIRPDEVYGHCGITQELEQENAEITLSMPASRISRPTWDLEILRGIGFRDVKVDAAAGKRILGPRDLADAPMFLLAGIRADSQFD